MTTEKRKRSAFPKTLGSLVEPLTRPVFKAQGLASSRLVTQWAAIVGGTLAARSFPVKISYPHGKTTDGTLTIAVENGFALEIQHLQLLIIEKLAVYFGYRAISRIVISHALTRQTIVKPDKVKKPPLPSSAAMDVESIDDEELKIALRSLALSMSEKRT